MITAGGPYQTNPAMVEKMRDLASVLNRVKMEKNAQKANSEVKRLQDAWEYASPPVHRRVKEREGRADIITPEHSVSPVITGLHNRNSRQRHRMRTPGSTGAGFGGVRAVGAGVGAHKT